MLVDSYEAGVLTVGDIETMSVSRLTPDIAYILAAGKAPPVAPFDTVHLDHLTYVIPKHSESLLAGMGACGLVAFWRRRSQRS